MFGFPRGKGIGRVRTGRSFLEGQRQGLEAAQAHCGAPFRMRIREREVRHPAQNCFECDAAFDLGEHFADASMGSRGE